jgi:hypothetical protein
VATKFTCLLQIHQSLNLKKCFNGILHATHVQQTTHTNQLFPKTIEGVNTLLGPIAISLLHHLKAIGSLIKIYHGKTELDIQKGYSQNQDLQVDLKKLCHKKMLHNTIL